MCTSKCSETSCPFAFTVESERIQDYACLPTPQEILTMRVHHGKTWACHSDNSIPCVGAIRELQARNLPHKVIDPELLTEKHPWDNYTEKPE